MSYPSCFPTHKQHGEWVHLARTSAEVCSICTDCTKDYESEMKLQGRCNKEFWIELEVNTRANAGQTRGASEGTVELRGRLEAIRNRAGEIARDFLSRNPCGF